MQFGQPPLTLCFSSAPLPSFCCCALCCLQVENIGVQVGVCPRAGFSIKQFVCCLLGSPMASGEAKAPRMQFRLRSVLHPPRYSAARFPLTCQRPLHPGSICAAVRWPSFSCLASMRCALRHCDSRKHGFNLIQRSATARRSNTTRFHDLLAPHSALAHHSGTMHQPCPAVPRWRSPSTCCPSATSAGAPGWGGLSHCRKASGTLNLEP